MEENAKLNLITTSENSLEVDPNNIYNMSDEQKKIIQYYIQFKNLAMAAEFAEIEYDIAKQYFVDYNSQSEIRRIHSELCKQQFQCETLSLDDIGGYLTSLIKEDLVPLGEQLKTTDKLKVISMLIELNKLKTEEPEKPDTVINNLNLELKNLSIDTIKKLLNNELDNEEIDYLNNLNSNELLEIIEENNKEK